MNKRSALIIAGVIIVSAMIVFGKPLLDNDAEQAYANPYVAYQEALAAGQPVFVDFFSPR